MQKTKKTKKNTSINHPKFQPKFQPNFYIGCHASIANGILEGIKYVESIGGNALQIFMGSKLQSSLKYKHKFKEQNEIDTIRNYLSRNKIVFIIHSIYTINLCKYPHTSGRIKYAHDNILYDLNYGQMLGAKCVVLHIGSKNKELTLEEALSNLVGNIKHILSKMPTGIMLSLETAAGSGNQLGWNLEELSKIWNMIIEKNKGASSNLAICVDTAHIFVSGYDISNENGIKEYLDKFNSLIGIKHISNFHINDSKYKLGSKVDEHRGIGYGNIYNTEQGKAALKYIKYFCIKHKIPMILETHSAGSTKDDNSSKDDNNYASDINLIKQL